MPRDPLDRYYTPPALAQQLVATLGILPGDVVLDPSAGGGAFLQCLDPALHTLHAVDIDPHAPVFDQQVHGALCDDFLRYTGGADWIIGNPPYKHAESHLRHALGLARVGCAFLFRLSFLESRKRAALWKEHPPTVVHVLTRRPSFTADGRTDSAAYAWYVWHTHRVHRTTHLRWFP